MDLVSLACKLQLINSFKKESKFSGFDSLFLPTEDIKITDGGDFEGSKELFEEGL